MFWKLCCAQEGHGLICVALSRYVGIQWMFRFITLNLLYALILSFTLLMVCIGPQTTKVLFWQVVALVVAVQAGRQLLHHLRKAGDQTLNATITLHRLAFRWICQHTTLIKDFWLVFYKQHFWTITRMQNTSRHTLSAVEWRCGPFMAKFVFIRPWGAEAQEPGSEISWYLVSKSWARHPPTTSRLGTIWKKHSY